MRASPQTYAALRRSVEAVLGAGRRDIEAAWLRTYHETGRLIHEHLLLHEDRAGYGSKVFTRLSDEAKISKRTLYECVQFYRCFPIVRALAQLGWNRCRLLCQVSDPKERELLLVQVRRQQWSAAELESRIRAHNAEVVVVADAPAPAAGPKPLTPRLGTPDRFRIVTRGESLAVDVGFKLYLPVPAALARSAKAGMIVRWSDGALAADPTATPADLFTYRATVRRIIDGDTLAVTIALPYYAMDEKLRLRGLDCPEIDTPEGRAAKRFVAGLVEQAAEITITTSKVDKYDRYLADVHVRLASGEVIFLNNALLEKGHAGPMSPHGVGEWLP